MSIAETVRSISFKKPVLKQQGKKLFWTWVIYQTVKGTLTTALIWVPLIWALWSQ